MCTCVHTSLSLFYERVLLRNFPFHINLPFQTCGHWFREYLRLNASVFADPNILGFILKTTQYNKSLAADVPDTAL